jgi:hypothetical protein
MVAIVGLLISLISILLCLREYVGPRRERERERERERGGGTAGRWSSEDTTFID